MQLGLVGLGRMGGNMRDRVRAAGHEVVGYDPRPRSPTSTRSPTWPCARRAPGRLGDGAVRRAHPRHRSASSPTCSTGRPGDRRRQLPLHRRRPERRAARRQGHRLRGLRRLRRHLGQGERLRADGRRLGRAHRARDADLRRAAAGGPARGGLRARRAGRAPGTSPRWCTTASSTASCRPTPRATSCCRPPTSSPTCRRPAGVVAWHGRAVVAAGPAGARAQGRPGLAKLEDYVEDSGEGRWTIEEAIRHAVPLPVISAALFARFASRQESSPAMRAVAALRHQFGGHAVHGVGRPALPVSSRAPARAPASTPS